mmetsp:Transcript_12347/g.18720  ORF Transcript_12347/g.18720 Transcript_12347/m.18720 type:complete len:551 (-) Transcript_12347:231-1883(-)
MSNNLNDKLNPSKGDVTETIPLKLWIAALLTALPSFLFGYVSAALNSCLLTGDADSESKCYYDNDDANPDCPPGTVYNDIKLSTTEAQMATSLMVAGAWIGSLYGNIPAQKYGRKSTVLMNNILFISGAIMCCVSNKWVLYVGRFLAGGGVGIESVVVPVLMSEISSAEHRGAITTLHQWMLTLGIFVAGLVGYGFVEYVNHGWVYVQAGIAIPAIINLLGAGLMYESPKWLISENRVKEAKEVITALRPAGYDTDAEMSAISDEIALAPDEETTWEEVFACRHAVIIGCGLMLAMAITGINTVIFYSATIFGFAGFDDAILATAAVGAVNFVATGVATYLVDKMGRKQLLVIGTSIMALALVWLGVVLLTANSVPSTQGVIAVIAVLLYVVGFAIGMGAVSWVVMSEVMTTRLRSKAFSLFVSINWGANFLIGLFTLSAIDGMGGTKDSMDDDEVADSRKEGVAYMYVMFAGICVAVLIFIFTYVPETKGKTPDDFMTETERLSLKGEVVQEGKTVENPMQGDVLHAISGSPAPSMDATDGIRRSEDAL